MQSINKAILNPWFFTIFLGSVISFIALVVLQYKIVLDTKFWFIFAAMVIYLIGMLGTTMFGNVPLNNTLEALQLSSLNPAEIETARADYEGRWNNFNKIRTICSIVSFILLLLSNIIFTDG